MRGQIYSLLPLTTRPPLQVLAGGPCGRPWCLCQPGARNASPASPRPPHLSSERSVTHVSGTDHDLDGAGEGNRTLVVSLEGFCSTIELHPRGTTSFNSLHDSSFWWWGLDSKQRSQRGQIYSLLPLTTRPPHREEPQSMKQAQNTVNSICLVICAIALTSCFGA